MDFAFHLLALVNCDLLLEKSFFTFPLRIKVKSSIEKLFSGIFLYPFILTRITEMDFFNQVFSYLVSCLVPCQGQEVFTISCPLNSCA